jgi:hypothetical protein
MEWSDSSPCQKNRRPEQAKRGLACYVSWVWSDLPRGFGLHVALDCEKAQRAAEEKMNAGRRAYEECMKKAKHKT